MRFIGISRHTGQTDRARIVDDDAMPPNLHSTRGDHRIIAHIAHDMQWPAGLFSIFWPSVDGAGLRGLRLGEHGVSFQARVR